MKKSDQKLVLVYFLTDIILLNGSLIVSLFIKYGGMIQFEARYKTLFILFNFIWLLVVYFANNRIMYWRNKPARRMFIQSKSFIAFIAAISIVLTLFKELDVSRTVLYFSIFIFFVNRIFFGYIIFRIIAYLRRHGKNIRRLLVIGAGKSGLQLYNSINDNIDLGFKIIGFLENNQSKSLLRKKIIGKVYDLDKILKSNHKIDEIVITLPLNREDEIKYALETADYYGIRIRLIPDFYQILDRSYTNGRIGDLPTLNVREVPLDDFVNAFFKRVFDITFSVSVLLFFLPLFAIIGVFIRFDSKGPVFFKPTRIGKNGRKFKLYKFRTMTDDECDNNSVHSTAENDHRITKVGQFLRKYSIDELPQFVNVLRGDMSVVGPRPHRIWLNNNMQKDVYGYMTRHYLYPGITGWAQINGWRGPTDTHLKKVERTNHDLWYMENWSLLLDFKIILLTMFGKKVLENAF